MTESDLPGFSPQELDEQRRSLKRRGYALIRLDDGPVHSYPYNAPWIDDVEFSRTYELVRRNTLVDRARCHSLYELAKQVRDLPGVVLEVGTWRGGTGAMLAQTLPDKQVYLADTFTGVVKAAEWEHYENHTHADTSEALVRGFLSGLRLSNVELLTGVFPEDTGDRIAHLDLSLVYLDLDVYHSTKDAFVFIWDQVVPGGVVVFDDYGMTSACGGISRFVHEIRGDVDKVVVPNLNGQACIVKRG